MHPAVMTLEEIIVRFGRQKRNGKSVVFTNGCFDLLHPGHIHSLEAARRLGDILIVGINSDESVRVLKGEDRPLIPEQERAEILARGSRIKFEQFVSRWFSANVSRSSYKVSP